MIAFPQLSLFLLLFSSGKILQAAPLSDSNELNLTDGVESIDDIAIIEDDDITTHGLERLSSAATCLVAGVEYTHGQQIYRADQCEFCLCLDGEMFCWWQECPPTMEGPCKDREPFSQCLSVPANGKQYTESKSASSSSTSTVSSTSNEMSNSAVKTATSSASTATDSTPVDTTYAATLKVLSSTFGPKKCIIMGQEYDIGSKLPHTTGNCVECICDLGGKVTCSPNQCSPMGEDINDYRPPDENRLGQQQPMVF